MEKQNLDKYMHTLVHLMVDMHEREQQLHDTITKIESLIDKMVVNKSEVTEGEKDGDL